MSTEQEREEMDLDELSKYVVMGLHKDTGEYVMVSSAGCSVQDMGMFCGRLVVDIQASIAQALAAQVTPGRILKP